MDRKENVVAAVEKDLLDDEHRLRDIYIEVERVVLGFVPGTFPIDVVMAFSFLPRSAPILFHISTLSLFHQYDVTACYTYFGCENRKSLLRV